MVERWTGTSQREIIRQLRECFDGLSGQIPNVMFIQRRVLHQVARRTMTKRGFYRWRGRQKAWARKQRQLHERMLRGGAAGWSGDRLIIDDPYAGMTQEQIDEAVAKRPVTDWLRPRPLGQDGERPQQAKPFLKPAIDEALE
mgnify:CR=1 FL=1